MDRLALKLALKSEEGEKVSWPKVRTIIQSEIKPIYWALLDAAKNQDMVSLISNLNKLVHELDKLAKYSDLQSLKLKLKQVEKIDMFKSE